VKQASMLYLYRVPTCTMSWLVAVAVLCCRTMGQSKCLIHLKTKTHILEHILYTVSEMEMIRLLLWNNGNITHIAKDPKLHSIF